MNSKLHNEFCLNSKEVIEKAIEVSTKSINDFKVGDISILLFSNHLLEYLKNEINMETYEWLAPYHPYASNQLYRGEIEGITISAISPPMGASPIASVAEDLITCGAKVLLLVCGAWGIAKNIKLLDYLIPTHAIGPDGTSIYYNRKSNQETILNEEEVNIIRSETEKRTADFHIGKNYSIEAFYRIEVKNVKDLQNNGFISMENGELNILATICNQKRVKFGAIFYSYYNPLEKWIIPWLKEDYKRCVELEGEITLASIKRIVNKT